jgi:hypothetical protein
MRSPHVDLSDLAHPWATMANQQPPSDDLLRPGEAATAEADADADAYADAYADAEVNARFTRRLAIGALVIALIAVGLTAWRLVSPAASCQSAAWGAAPSIADLPAAWSISATQYDVDRMSMTLLGPLPQGQTSARPVVYATVACYAHDAAAAVAKSQAAATAAGQTVSSRADLGDQGYTALDSSGASFIQFRHGDVVTYVAASSQATAAEVEAVASAFDRALGGAGSAAAIGTSGPSNGVSAVPTEAASSAAPASTGPSPSGGVPAPELEAALPRTVAGTTLTISSAVGASVLGTDAGSRAITAALRADGKSGNDFRAAQAHDATGTVDLTILALRVTGMKSAALQKIVLDTWLSASGTGVKTSAITLGSRAFTKVDYGDGGPMSYITARGDIVIIIETAVADLAAQAAAALP